MIVDLTNVGFLDTVGVAALAAAWKVASRHDTELCLAAARPNITRVLHLTGLAKVIALYPTVTGALTSHAHHAKTRAGLGGVDRG